VAKKPATPERVRVTLRLPGMELLNAGKLLDELVSVECDGEPLHAATIAAVEQLGGELRLEVAATRWPSEPCRSENCGVLITWAMHATRHTWVPVEAASAPDGTYLLEQGSVAGDAAVLCREPPAHLRFGRRDLRRSHFRTCPDASNWRKRP
jgi:hypothetical protein